MSNRTTCEFANVDRQISTQSLVSIKQYKADKIADSNLPVTLVRIYAIYYHTYEKYWPLIDCLAVYFSLIPVQLINSTVIWELSTIFFPAAYIRGLISSGRLVSWGLISEGLTYPGAYIQGHISRGLITRSLYLGDFYLGDFYPGAYIRGEITLSDHLVEKRVFLFPGIICLIGTQQHINK